jgi:hypothetical protein
MKTIQLLLDWSEAWAPLLALIVYFITRPKARWVKPVLYFLVIAFIFGLALDLIWKRRKLGIEPWFETYLWWWWDTDPVTGEKILKNNIFYNLTSLARLLAFTAFFHLFYDIFKKLNRFIPWIFIALMVVNFTWFENIKDFSSRQLTVEAAILLFYCLLFFYKTTLDVGLDRPSSQPQFWVVAGLTLYTAVNFFIFLFYKYLMSQVTFAKYAVEIWNVHNISYILLNIFIIIAFIRSKRNG